MAHRFMQHTELIYNKTWMVHSFGISLNNNVPHVISQIIFLIVQQNSRQYIMIAPCNILILTNNCRSIIWFAWFHSLQNTLQSYNHMLLFSCICHAYHETWLLLCNCFVIFIIHIFQTCMQISMMSPIKFYE